MATITLTDAFKDALGRIGFSHAAQDEIVDQGVTTMAQMLHSTNASIATLCKIACKDEYVEISFTEEQRLHALHTWVANHTRCGLPVTAALFTLEIADEMLMQLTFQSELAAVKDPTKLAMPDKFLKPPLWLIWKEAVFTYLQQLLSSNHILPLSYIARYKDRPDPTDKFQDEKDRMTKSSTT